MEIVLSSIGDKGDAKNERIGFKVLKDCELKYFMVFSSFKVEVGFYNKSKDAYWFLPMEVKTGDKIVLYTKEGKDSVTKNEDGSNTYFFYWGLESPIFKNESIKVVLASIKTWRVIP